MEYTIHGSTMQAVVLTLQSGESVITESGGMAWQTGHVKMDTTMPGGLFGGLKRKFTGESFFMTTYEAREANCLVAFTPFAPGKGDPSPAWRWKGTSSCSAMRSWWRKARWT